jgi:hypothetical protein
MTEFTPALLQPGQAENYHPLLARPRMGMIPGLHDRAVLLCAEPQGAPFGRQTAASPRAVDGGLDSRRGAYERRAGHP